MAEYFGAAAICQALHISDSTLQKWFILQRFPMFRRWSKDKKGRPRKLWYTNDSLIRSWQLAQAEAERKAWLASHRPNGWERNGRPMRAQEGVRGEVQAAHPHADVEAVRRRRAGV